MPENLENSAVATGLEKVSFHSNPKEKQGGKNKKFLSEKCKEIEENNRMGKTRDLFKKIRSAKGTFHTKMGTINDRNGMDLREAEDIKRWKECTKELYKKSPLQPRLSRRGDHSPRARYPGM